MVWDCKVTHGTFNDFQMRKLSGGKLRINLVKQDEHGSSLYSLSTVSPSVWT